MRTSTAGLSAPVGLKWLLAMLAPALIVGIVLMHSLGLQPGAGDRHGSYSEAMTAASAEHLDHAPAVAVTGGAGQEDPAGHGTDGGMADCGGLITMCLALVVSFLVFVARPRAASRWVLWQRPPPTFIRMGVVRDAFFVMSARQRTTVIRC